MAKTNRPELAPFDASDYLDSEEVIAEYLTVALEDPDPDAFMAAVSDVAKARGMTDVAAHAGLGRESLYKALRPGAQPRFDTVRRLLTALGVRLDVVATAQETKRGRIQNLKL
jgi:probable addiction module antidote protein